MDEQIFKFADMSVQRHSWCVEWFGSQGDFIAGKAKEPISLSRFAGLHGRGRQGFKAQKGRRGLCHYQSFGSHCRQRMSSVDRLPLTFSQQEEHP